MRCFFSLSKTERSRADTQAGAWSRASGASTAIIAASDVGSVLESRRDILVEIREAVESISDLAMCSVDSCGLWLFSEHHSLPTRFQDPKALEIRLEEHTRTSRHCTSGVGEEVLALFQAQARAYATGSSTAEQYVRYVVTAFGLGRAAKLAPVLVASNDTRLAIENSQGTFGV